MDKDMMDIWDNERLKEIIFNLEDEKKALNEKLKILFDSYIKVRLEYSGSWGNLSQDRRREVMINEIEAELGWKITNIR